MISTLIKVPARTAVGTVLLVARPTVWLVRTVGDVALKPLQREQPPSASASPTQESPTQESPTQESPTRESPTAESSSPESPPPPKPSKPRRARRASAAGKASSPRPSAGKTARNKPSGTSSRKPRQRDTPVTLPPADPTQPGVPGRDVPPELPEEPHHMLNTPVGEPDPTEWPDPYDRRPDPRDPDPDDPIPIGDVPHTPTGAQSTSEPHPHQDPEAVHSKPPERDTLDE